jgi:hypothetical protein
MPWMGMYNPMYMNPWMMYGGMNPWMYGMFGKHEVYLVSTVFPLMQQFAG